MTATGKDTDLDRADRLAHLFRIAAERDRGVLLIVEGVAFPTIQYVIKQVVDGLDPRHFELLHVDHDVESKRGVPFLHEFWAALPRRGDLLILDRSYYFKLVRGRTTGQIGKSVGERLLYDIRDFERGLEENGYFVLRVYIDQSRKDLKSDKKKRKEVTMRVLESRYRDLLKHFNDYDSRFAEILAATGADAEWFHLHTEKRKRCLVSVMDYLIARLEEKLEVDSRKEVAEFDLAMQRKRERERDKAAGGSA